MAVIDLFLQPNQAMPWGMPMRRTEPRRCSHDLLHRVRWGS